MINYVVFFKPSAVVAEEKTTMAAPTGPATGSSVKTTNKPKTHEKHDNKGKKIRTFCF